jgi:hypothetical protein
MKKILSLSLTVLVCLGAAAQGKYFKDAIKQGRAYRQLYQIKNDKEKMIKLEDLVKFCHDNDYLMGKYTKKEIGRFGDVAISINTFDFIPRGEQPQYFAEHMNSKAHYADFKNVGTVYYFNPRSANFFQTLNDVMWTGEVANGKIQGTGEGFKQTGTNTFICFSGTFRDGLLVGEGSFGEYTHSTSDPEYSPSMKTSASTKTGNLSEGLAWFTNGDNYGYVNANGQTVIKPIFKKASDFSGGRAVAYADRLEVFVDKGGNVVDFGPNQQLTYYEIREAKNKYPQLKGAAEKKVSQYVGTVTKMDALAEAYKDFPATLPAIEVKAKELIAKSDISFSDLKLAEKSFPTLATLVKERKDKHYADGCARLDHIIATVVASAKAGNRDFTGRDYVKEFKDTYSDYDANGRMADVKELSEYYEVCDIVGMGLPDCVTYDNETITGGFILVRVPSYYGVNSQVNEMNWAKDVCAKPSKLGFASFYQQLSTQLDSKITRFKNYASKEYDRYLSEKSAYDAKEAERKKRLLNMTWKELESCISEPGEWSRGRLVDTDDDYTDHRLIVFYGPHDNYDRTTFTEIITTGRVAITLHERYQKNSKHYFYFEDENYKEHRYRTEFDCIKGAYLYKFGVNTDLNRMGDDEYR